MRTTAEYGSKGLFCRGCHRHLVAEVTEVAAYQPIDGGFVVDD
jgi:hypothetical protein